MSLVDKFKKGLEKAKEGASELAEITKKRVEISKLNGHRTEAISELGRQVYALYGQGRTVPELEAACQQIRH